MYNFPDIIKGYIEEALKNTYDLTLDTIIVEVPNDTTNGDYSTNVAMQLARTLRKAPFMIAETLVESLKEVADESLIDSVTVAKPGFINFFINKSLYLSLIPKIHAETTSYGNLTLGEGEHFNIEFVSANPTGTLHIGHARGAAAGDTLARILKKAGYQVTREFYVNDGGNQIHNLTLSIQARYEALLGKETAMPEDGYFGKEIISLAETLVNEVGDQYLKKDGYAFFKQYGVDYLLSALKDDLASFNVEFDVFFSEASLYKNNEVEATVKFLSDNDYTYEEEGALWLKTEAHGDEKDRVIVKSDGTYTYLLPDIAYHKNKLDRGFTKLIDILGGDHHGYVARLKAAIEMVGGKSNLLDVDLLQMVKVIQNGEEVKMSKRSGKAITLIDLIEEVGPEPIRYFFAMRSLNTHMDLDLDLALKESNENPVYYAQYAHARIVRLKEQAASKGYTLGECPSTFDTLNSEKVDTLLTTLASYPDVISEAASKRLMHRVTHFIQRLATALHAFYSDEQIITDDETYTLERLYLLEAVRIVLSDALMLVGVKAKDRM